MSHIPPMPTLDEIVRQHVMLVLAFHRGNVTRAARTLNCSRTTLHTMLKKWKASQQGVGY